MSSSCRWPRFRVLSQSGWPACYREGFGGTSLDSDAERCASRKCVNRSWQARQNSPTSCGSFWQNAFMLRSLISHFRGDPRFAQIVIKTMSNGLLLQSVNDSSPAL
jgi:hypothetical protein